MKLPAALPKPVGSLRSQILIVTLVPSLLTVLGLVGYLISQAPDTGETLPQAVLALSLIHI